MNYFKRLIFILLACMMCHLSYSQSLQKRYRFLTKFIFLDTASHKNYFEITPTVLSLNQQIIKTPVKPRTLYDLSEKGQKQLIADIAAKSPDAKSLIEMLKEALEKPDQVKAKELEKYFRVVPNEFKKTFNIYVNRVLTGKFMKDGETIAFRNDRADRIENLKVMVVIDPQSDLKFLMWDKLKNKDTTINLGQIATTSNFEASITGTLGIKNTLSTESNTKSVDSTSEKDMVPTLSEDLNSGSKENASKTSGVADASANVSASSKYSKTVSATRQFMNKETMFSGFFEEKRFFVDLLSIEGYDLVGSTFVTMTCKYEGDYTSTYFNKFENLSTESVINGPSSIKHYKMLLAYPDVKENVTAQVSYGFLYRNVIGWSARWYLEYKQRISYLYGSTFQLKELEQPSYEKSASKAYQVAASQKGRFNLPVQILKKDEFKPKIYTLVSEDNQVITTDNQRLQFESRSEALEFLVWLKLTSQNAANIPWVTSTFSIKEVTSIPVTTSVTDWLVKSITVVD